jgi:hypothetical protein
MDIVEFVQASGRLKLILTILEAKDPLPRRRRLFILFWGGWTEKPPEFDLWSGDQII